MRHSLNTSPEDASTPNLYVATLVQAMLAQVFVTTTFGLIATTTPFACVATSTITLTNVAASALRRRARPHTQSIMGATVFAGKGDKGMVTRGVRHLWWRGRLSRWRCARLRARGHQGWHSSLLHRRQITSVQDEQLRLVTQLGLQTCQQRSTGKS